MFGFLKRHRFVLLLLVGAAGFAIWYFLIRADTRDGLLIKRQDLTDSLTLSGEVDAEERSTMTFQTAGKLSFIKVKEGDAVKKGQVLAGLDTGDLAAAEREAFYKYLAADANAKKVEDDVKDHDKDESFTQKKDRVAAQTDRDIKYDDWLSAQRALRYATLFSPIEGVVYDIPPTSPGEFITTTNPVHFEIVNPETIYFSATADQTEVGRLEIGQKGKVTLDAFADSPFDEEVTKISFTPKEDETGTVYEVKLSLAEGKELRPRLGMTGDVNFVLSELPDVIAVPSRYIKTIEGEKTVIKYLNGRKQNVKVEVGREVDGLTIVTSGLNEGETIYDKTR